MIQQEGYLSPRLCWGIRYGPCSCYSYFSFLPNDSDSVNRSPYNHCAQPAPQIEGSVTQNIGLQQYKPDYRHEAIFNDYLETTYKSDCVPSTVQESVTQNIRPQQYKNDYRNYAILNDCLESTYKSDIVPKHKSRTTIKPIENVKCLLPMQNYNAKFSYSSIYGIEIPFSSATDISGEKHSTETSPKHRSRRLKERTRRIRRKVFKSDSQRSAVQNNQIRKKSTFN